MIYVLWAIVLFFACAWTLGVVTQPHMRLKSTLATIGYWWISISLAALSLFSAWHLLWLMPLSVLVPMGIMQAEISTSFRASLSSIFFKSAFVIGPALAAVIYFSRA